MDKAKVERMIELREERGFTVPRIARALGLNKSTVDYHLLAAFAERNGIAPRRRPNAPMLCFRLGRPVRRFSDEESARLEAMAIAGASQIAMARALGRQTSSVRQHLLILARRAARAEAQAARSLLPARGEKVAAQRPDEGLRDAGCLRAPSFA